MKKVLYKDKPFLVLFAVGDIEVGEQICYDYGSGTKIDAPWRNKGNVYFKVT